MSSQIFYASVVLAFMAFQPLVTSIQSPDEDRKVYIVYMGSIEKGAQLTSLYHVNMLQEVVDSRFVKQALVRSYTRSFNGFAANLTSKEHEKLASHREVVSIFPSTTFYTQTTRSWDFMGFSENVHRSPITGSDIIIGVIDSGISPESQSFKGEGFSPPPKKWKGLCKGGQNFTCNNKLIGARYYGSGDSARDDEGHGTHISSIAAGNYVKDVSFYGIAEGTARGGVPSARIAAYKVCYPSTGCSSEDVLAAFDDAIADGVDIITISVGGQDQPSLENDPIALGSLHASQKGILVVHSVGNSGDFGNGTVESVAPWIFSVAASTTDRGIISKVSIGSGTTFTGKAVNSFHLNGKKFPLVYGKDVSNSCDISRSQACEAMCMNRSLVKGKIVLCNTYSGIDEAFNVGALGAIALSDFSVNVSMVVPFAASMLTTQDFKAIENYYRTTRSPTADILTSESTKNLDAPRVASFSSRGPNTILPDILKPDVTAPGVEILAAYSPKAPPSENSLDLRSVKFNILSGTSMACPHVAGAAAYVKSMHPNWSPSAIKSALMTTAWKMNATIDPLAEFSYGAGHIDPVKATDPGLVYETSSQDYLEMLCSLGYDDSTIRKIFGGNSSCLSRPKLTSKDLNYPSMTIKLSAKESGTITAFSTKFTRTVTNVGVANSTYNVTTSKSLDYNITVTPSSVTFKALNEKKSFDVLISGKIDGPLISAALEWSDGVRNVRSPIVVYRD